MDASIAPNKRVQLIQSLIDELDKLPTKLSGDDKQPLVDGANHLRQRSEMIIRKTFGASSPYLEELRAVRFWSGSDPYRPTKWEILQIFDTRVWHTGKTQVSHLLETMLEEAQEFSLTQIEESADQSSRTPEGANISMTDPVSLLEDLARRLDSLPELDHDGLAAFMQEADMIIRKVFGNESRYLDYVGPFAFRRRATDSYYRTGITYVTDAQSWRDGKKALLNAFNVMIKELQISLPQSASVANPHLSPTSNRVFVVHGHDLEMREAMANTLRLLGLEPVILQDEIDMNRTIIQKFIDESADIDFAVALLSPDDIAYSKRDKSNNPKIKPTRRARQNVILELGYFIGKLGMENVFVLRSEDKDWDVPSDYAGVLYTPYDKPDGVWRAKLVSELKARKFPVDANALF